MTFKTEIIYFIFNILFLTSAAAVLICFKSAIDRCCVTGLVTLAFEKQ